MTPIEPIKEELEELETARKITLFSASASKSQEFHRSMLVDGND